MLCFTKESKIWTLAQPWDHPPIILPLICTALTSERARMKSTIPNPVGNSTSGREQIH